MKCKKVSTRVIHSYTIQYHVYTSQLVLNATDSLDSSWFPCGSLHCSGHGILIARWTLLEIFCSQIESLKCSDTTAKVFFNGKTR